MVAGVRSWIRIRIFTFFLQLKPLKALIIISMEGVADHTVLPLVLQCMNCRTIVGDTTHLLATFQVHSLIILSAATDVQRDGDIITSRSGDDVGSTYYKFACKHCNSSLGRYYLTTSKDLDGLRERFAFHVDKISSYQLGSSSASSAEEMEEEDEERKEEVVKEEDNALELNRVSRL